MTEFAQTATLNNFYDAGYEPSYEFPGLDLPILDLDSDDIEEDIWFDQWASDLPRRNSEDSSPTYCE